MRQSWRKRLTVDLSENFCLKEMMLVPQDKITIDAKRPQTRSPMKNVVSIILLVFDKTIFYIVRKFLNQINACIISRLNQERGNV